MSDAAEGGWGVGLELSGGGCSSGAELEADAAIVSAAKLQSLWFWGGFLLREGC